MAQFVTSPTPDEITRALYDERPLAMDKRYHECSAWEKGACDEWNTVLLRFAGMLFPVAKFGLNVRQRWIDAMVAGELDGAQSVIHNLDDDVPY